MGYQVPPNQGGILTRLTRPGLRRVVLKLDVEENRMQRRIWGSSAVACEEPRQFFVFLAFCEGR